MKRLWNALIITITFLALSPSAQAAEEQKEEKNKLFSYGGQVRLRYDATQNQSLEDFSYDPGKSETQLLNRTRVHVESNPADWVRLYFEPQFYGRWGGYDNEDRLSVYQSYVELRNFCPLPVALKVGRQDFVYGSAFFMGNDDFYRGLTWDGAKIIVQPLPDLTVDLIAARLVSFTSNKAEQPGLYGFYSTYSGIKDIDWDFYFFYNRHGFKNLEEHLSDSPLWFTAGTRFAMKMLERLNLEVEPMYQFGRLRNFDRVGDDQIRAYGGHVDLTYELALPYEPRLMASYAFGTGDSNSKDNTFREFQGSLYNDSSLFGDMNVVPDVSGIEIGEVRASGMKVITVSSSIKLSPKLSLCLDWHHFTADKTPDGYSKTVGCETDLFLTYELSEKVNILASANRFFTNDIFRQATGERKDVNYFYLQAQVEF
ncbi:MAG: alginate export family protein [Proteobacteria bacterium]|nr:alginate export family protein [Pseudomonadota bacterium]